MSTIYLRVEKSFGNVRFYPKGLGEAAPLLLRLMKQSSFTEDQVRDLKRLGYEIIVVQPEDKIEYNIGE